MKLQLTKKLIATALCAALAQASFATETLVAPTAPIAVSAPAAVTTLSDADASLAFGSDATAQQLDVLSSQEMKATEGTNIAYLAIVGALVWYAGQVIRNIYNTQSGYGTTHLNDVMYRGQAFAGVTCHTIQWNPPKDVCYIGG